MWENVQIFVYQVSEFHKCLLQKVTLTIKYLFAIESNADYKIFWLQITHSIQETQNDKMNQMQKQDITSWTVSPYHETAFMT